MAQAKTTVKKVESKVKSAAKKVVRKPSVKKTAAKKTSAKAPKTSVIMQFGGKEVICADVVKKATQLSKKALKKDAKEIKIYVKPEENMAYYVANGGDEIGSFAL